VEGENPAVYIQDPTQCFHARAVTDNEFPESFRFAVLAFHGNFRVGQSGESNDRQ
jgi:hypothetical protein